MENQEYLNQLAAKVRPDKAPKSSLNIFNSVYTKLILGAVVGFIAIMLFGMLLGGTHESEKDKLSSLALRIQNTGSVIATYQSRLKSSNLRSNTASLASVLSNTSRDLEEFNVVSKEKDKEKEKLQQKLVADETKAKEALEEELFSAKINGILDEIFAVKMAYEISVITTREVEIIDTTKNEQLKAALMTSYDSLANLYDKFNDFSEANNSKEVEKEQDD